MKILNSVKKFSKKFLNFKFVKVIVPILVIIPLLLIQFSVPVSAAEDDFNYTRVPGYINNPLAAFPSARFIYYYRDLANTSFEQNQSMYDYQGNVIDNTSAIFRGKFLNTSQFDRWSNRTGVFKVFLRGNAPIKRLYAGDSIRLRCSININWKVTERLIEGDPNNDTNYNFGFLPTRVRCYFACNSAATGEYKSYPIDGFDGELNYVFDEVPSTGLWAEDIYREYYDFDMNFPSLDDPFLNPDFAHRPAKWPYNQVVRPYTTSVTGDFTVTLPEDVYINEQPFHLCFDTEQISGNGKYERVNDIEFEMHNFNMTVLTSPTNLAISQLEQINQDLNNIFNVHGDPIIPSDIRDKFTDLEINEDNIYEVLMGETNAYDYLFDSGINTLTSPEIISALAMTGRFLTGIVNIPFLSNFFYVAIPIGALALIATVTTTVFSKTRNSTKSSRDSTPNNSNKH